MSTALFVMSDTFVVTASPEPTSLSSAGEISIFRELETLELRLYLSLLSSVCTFTLAANETKMAAKNKTNVFIND